MLRRIPRRKIACRGGNQVVEDNHVEEGSHDLAVEGSPEEGTLDMPLEVVEGMPQSGGNRKNVVRESVWCVDSER